MNEFGRFIKQMRESKKMTLTEVAEAAGINHSHLSRIENGDRNAPKAATLQKLATVLGVSFLKLMELAGYWDKLDEKEKEEMAGVYKRHDDAERTLLTLLREIANDDSKFPGGMHKDIYRVFGGHLPIDSQEHFNFDEWYSNNYLNVDPEELTDSDHTRAYEEFNKFYNYTTIKESLSDYNGLKSVFEFLDETNKLLEKHNIKTPDPEEEREFNPFEIFELVDKYSDDEIIEKFHHRNHKATSMHESKIRTFLQHVRFLKSQK